MSKSEYTPREEFVNSVTHGLGLLMSVVGLIVLICLAAAEGDPRKGVAYGIFGGSMVLLYAASTLYHSISHPKVKHAMRIFDHCAIYVLIAGTYTPFMAINFGGTWIGWTYLIVIWGLAIAGISVKAFHLHHSPWFVASIYVAMGWLGALAIKPALTAVPAGGLAWLFAGGIVYTVGVLFYAFEKLPYSHGIWHGFVMGGTTCHYIAVILATAAFAQPTL